MTLDRNIRVANNPTRDVWVQLLQLKQEHAGYTGNDFTPHEVVSRIFDLTTYDSEVDEIFTEAIVSVLEAIRDKKAFEYQRESKTKYLTYLLVVNHRMIHPLLNWGTSVRGAWFELGVRYGSLVSLTVEDFVQVPDEVASFLPSVDTDEGMVEFIYGLRMFLDTAKKE